MLGGVGLEGEGPNRSCADPMQGAVLAPHMMEDGSLVLAPIVIGARARVGIGAVVGPGAALDEGASLAPRTVVPPGAALPPLTSWEGSPARRTDQDYAELLVQPQRSTLKGMSRKQLAARTSLRRMSSDSLGDGGSGPGPEPSAGSTAYLVPLVAGIFLSGASVVPGVMATFWAWQVRLLPGWLLPGCREAASQVA